MNSFNAGEWSELYTTLFLLAKPNLTIVNSSLDTINDKIYQLKKIIFNSKIKLEYEIDKSGNEISVYANNKLIKKYSKEEIQIEDNKILKEILIHKTKKGSFNIPDSQSFINEITDGISFKSKSTSKSDITISFINNFDDKEYTFNYSIKSSLGSPATILNASTNTNFKYEITNFSKEKLLQINSINTKNKLLERIKKIKSYSDCKIIFDSMVSSDFEYNLKLIDSSLPQYLANALLYSYEYDNKNLKQIFKLSNDSLTEENANRKLGEFLNGISFGFVPGEKWNGIYSVNGGLILVKNDGRVVILDLINHKKEVNKYLINESKLDSPSSNRYHMLEIFEQNGKFYFTLNLQVRYK